MRKKRRITKRDAEVEAKKVCPTPPPVMSKEEISSIIQLCRKTGKSLKVVLAKYERQSIKDTHPRCLFWWVELPSGKVVEIPEGPLEPVCKKNHNGLSQGLTLQAKASGIYWQGLLENWVCVGKEGKHEQ